MNTKDVSDKSIRLLEEAVKHFLGTEPWVVDWGKEYRPDGKVFTSAIAMGSYFVRIFELQYWPSADFKLYCLSPSVKKILIDVFHFDPEKVGCLSRYDLFPRSVECESFQLLPESQMYYAGRISPQKNIEFLILTFFYLQVYYSSKLTLTLIGDFDNEYHKDILGCPFGEYKNKITTLIAGIPWPGTAPQFIQGKNESEWMNSIPADGVFISCSNLISEDFSVTAAQIEQRGKPMILPFWGGLADVTAKNVRFYHSDLIAHSHADLKTINTRAKKFSQELAAGHFIDHTPQEQKTFHPECINRRYLEEKMKTNRQRWGNAVDLMAEGNVPLFVQSEAGQTIFAKCREIFARSNR